MKGIEEAARDLGQMLCNENVEGAKIARAMMAFAAAIVAAPDMPTRDACARERAARPLLVGGNDGVKVGDKFQLKGPSIFPRTVYGVSLPGETYPGMVPVMLLEGFGWVPTSDLVNEINFERVPADEQGPTALDRAAASPALHKAIAAPAVSLVGRNDLPDGAGARGETEHFAEVVADIAATMPDGARANLIAMVESNGGDDLDGHPAPRGEVGDRFERLYEPHKGGVYVVNEVRAHGRRLLTCLYPGGIDTVHRVLGELNDATCWRALAAGVKVGDTFRCVLDGPDGPVSEVVAGPFPSVDGWLGRRWEIDTMGRLCLRTESFLLDPTKWNRVRAVSLPPVLAPPAPPSQGGRAAIDPHELLACARALLAVARQWRDEQGGYASSTTVELRDRLDALAALPGVIQ